MDKHGHAPENRWYRWLLWGVLVLPYIVAYFHRLSIGVLRPDLVTEFALSATAFAQIGAAYFYVYAFLQIPAGILSDSLGPRLTMSVSALISALGAAVFALAGSGGVLFLGRLVIGVGVASVFISILKVLAVWFDEGEFATLTGLTAGVGTLGAIGAQTPLYLASQRWGWRPAFLTVALISVITAVLCFLLVRDEPPAAEARPQEQPQAQPEKTTADMRVAEMRHPETHLTRELRAAFTNPRTWPPWMIFAGVYGAFIALAGTWGQSFLVIRLGLPATTASNMLTLTVVGIAVGGILFAMISDYLRRRRLPMIICSSLCLVFWIVLVSGVVTGVTALRLLLFSIGLTSGVVLTTLPCGKEVNHPAFSGTSTSVVNVGGFLGSALIPVVMGQVLDHLVPRVGESQAYGYALWVCVGAVFLGVVASLLVTETGCRNIYFSLSSAPVSGSASASASNNETSRT